MRDSPTSFNEKTNRILDRIDKYHSDHVTGKVANFLIDRRDEDLDFVAEKFAEAFPQSKITIFVKTIQTHVGVLIAEDATDSLLMPSKKELFTRAEAENIPIRKMNYKLIDDVEWMGRAQVVDPKGLDKTSYIKECLKWTNCLFEFYSGEPLIQEPKFEDFAQEEVMEDSEPKPLERTQLSKEEEAVFYKLWENGYLQCGLDKS